LVNYQKIFNIMIMKLILYIIIKRKFDKFYLLIDIIKFFKNINLDL
jgi:hypothetical protein